MKEQRSMDMASQCSSKQKGYGFKAQMQTSRHDAIFDAWHKPYLGRIYVPGKSVGKATYLPTTLIFMEEVPLDCVKGECCF